MGTANRNKEIVDLLLKYGANYDIQDKNGDTALIIAVKTGNVDIFNKLIVHGADMEKRNRQDKTALFISVFLLDIEIAEILLKNGADTEKHSNNISPLEWIVLEYDDIKDKVDNDKVEIKEKMLKMLRLLEKYC